MTSTTELWVWLIVALMGVASWGRLAWKHGGTSNFLFLGVSTGLSAYWVLRLTGVVQ